MTTPSADEAAIRQTVHDYYRGWYEGNADQHAHALHPHLAKRAVKKSPGGDDYLYRLTKEQMVMATAQGEGAKTPVNQRDFTITQLDVYKEIASVKVESYEYIEYLHLARENGVWLIVNALYTLNHNHAS